MKAIMDAQELKRLIAATKDFISVETMKSAHKYIKLDFYAEENAVRASALNGIVLSTEWARCHDVDENFSILIKPVLPPIPKHSNALVEKLEDERTSISIGGMNLIYQTGDVSKFLDVDAAIPTIAPDFRIAANGVSLMRALKAASTRDPLNRTVELCCNGPLNPIFIKTKAFNGRKNVKVICPVRLRPELEE